MITNDIYLINGVNLTNDYDHTFTFPDKETQSLYFFNKSKVYSAGEYSYLRRENIIQIAENIDTLQTSNYLMTRQSNGDKWFYYFIIKKDYVNENTTALTVELDVMQTFLFEYTFRHTFIDREHVDRWARDKTPIYSMIPENLLTGDEYELEASFKADHPAGIRWFLVVSSISLTTAGGVKTPTPMLTKTPTPFFYYLIPYYQGAQLNSDEGTMLLTVENFETYLSDYQKIISVSYIPYLPFTFAVQEGNNGLNLIFDENVLKAKPVNNGEVTATNHILEFVGDIGEGVAILCRFATEYGYTYPTIFAKGTPRDKRYESKLYCYPYRYNLLTDWRTAPAIIKNEYLKGPEQSLMITQNINNQLKTRYWIRGYKGSGDTYGRDNSLINATVNDLALTTDAYKNYLLNNRASINSGLALASLQIAGGIVGGIATGGVGALAGAGAVMSGSQKIYSEVMKQKDMQTIPDTVRNAGNNISFDLAENNTALTFFRYKIADEIMQIVADYFMLYGYKSNSVKVPNTKSRYYYNYIKTINCNITANLDLTYLNRIMAIYDNGVTLWHYRGDDFDPLNYQYDNVEMNLL